MDIVFPGGLARVSNDHVWAELSRYCQETDGGAVSLWRNGDGKFQALLSPEHGQEYRGASRISLADAVAQALTTWMAARGAA